MEFTGLDRVGSDFTFITTAAFFRADLIYLRFWFVHILHGHLNCCGAVVARVWYDLCHNPYYLTCYVFCLCLCAKVRKVCVCYCIFHAIQPLYRLLCKILLNYLLLLLFLFNLRILSYVEALSISYVPWTTIMCILLQYKCEIMDICIATYRYTSNLQNIALWARTSISIYVWEIENKSHAFMRGVILHEGNVKRIRGKR
jgi:hypothetical protein